jgi:hypothetical protein
MGDLPFCSPKQISHRLTTIKAQFQNEAQDVWGRSKTKNLYFKKQLIFAAVFFPFRKQAFFRPLEAISC